MNIKSIEEKELDYSYQVGISSGLREAAKYILDLACEEFKNGEQNADLLKKISDTLLQKSKEAHPGVRK